MDFKRVIQEHQSAVERMMERTIPDIERAAAHCWQAIAGGGTIYLCGNGGSAADAQHIAAEFVGRFVAERRALPALAFTTDTSILTSVGNDYGFADIFKRQAEAFAKSGDVLIGISTSGGSKNVIAALAAARARGAVAIGFTGGKAEPMAEAADLIVSVPSAVTARVQECHILIGHMICAYIDEKLSSQ